MVERSAIEVGYSLDFAGARETFEKVFGLEPIGPAEMTKRLWEYVRDYVPYSKLGDKASDVEAMRLVEEGTHGDHLTETEKTALVLSRRGQGQFRDRLIALWEGRCAVTGCRDRRLLRASHLKPWKPSSNAERLDPFNGLLLSRHLDARLDCGLITFTDDGQIRMSPSLARDDGQCLGVHRTMKLHRVDRRHIPYLRFHRSIVFRK